MSLDFEGLACKVFVRAGLLFFLVFLICFIMTGFELIKAELKRLQDSGTLAGFQALTLTPNTTLLLMADGYAFASDAKAEVPDDWPLPLEHWQPKDAMTNLILAGALFLAVTKGDADYLPVSTDSADGRVEWCADMIDLHLAVKPDSSSHSKFDSDEWASCDVCNSIKPTSFSEPPFGWLMFSDHLKVKRFVCDFCSNQIIKQHQR